ncbi:hypothetical protein P6144_00980 [Sphingomonas sp. HITSZ_GF]|uniref:hypothetical protein n=1 Tax=Sphingomonas sp. HITSZ_GF TaxID=3037247 RepID=UPI00240DADE5|nr:hypothetical protein [Sphingomonas sp. HITSZ_GF]MDG2532207.1 hypothetical protein [Sphingomonas sp. HITSZ_GF]
MKPPLTNGNVSADLNGRYGAGYRAGRLGADNQYSCPTLIEMRRVGWSDEEALAYTRGFYNRCLETDPLDAIDRVSEAVTSMRFCAGHGDRP